MDSVLPAVETRTKTKRACFSLASRNQTTKAMKHSHHSLTVRTARPNVSTDLTVRRDLAVFDEIRETQEIQNATKLCKVFRLTTGIGALLSNKLQQ